MEKEELKITKLSMLVELNNFKRSSVSNDNRIYG